jgi:hypothetical protein
VRLGRADARGVGRADAEGLVTAVGDGALEGAAVGRWVGVAPPGPGAGEGVLLALLDRDGRGDGVGEARSCLGAPGAPEASTSGGATGRGSSGPRPSRVTPGGATSDSTTRAT